ncbi:MAG TPA: DUF5989 family protein, partial [Planctomycetaceae bacterium]|nr:DUF5989 family protein [Planctomycetaceae bacterium]
RRATIASSESVCRGTSAAPHLLHQERFNVPQQQNPDSGSPRNEFEHLGEGRQLSLAAEFWLFITESKKWWLIPILLVFSLLGVLILLASTGAAPFIYTIF